MHLKPHFVYENKTIFIYFLTISGILHLIFIFSTSSISNFLKPDLNFSDYGTKDSDYVIEIDLGSEKPKEENVENEELVEEELAEEEELIEADVHEEKRSLFVDTSGKTTDEEAQAETNKIGEKGSIARDMYAGEENINDKPRLESETVFPGEAPDELASAVSQKSDIPEDVSISEPVKDVEEETVEDLIEEETVASLPDANNSEELIVNDEVEEFEKAEDEPVENVDEEAVENLVKEEAVASLSEADNSEELPVDDEVEESEKTEDESVAQDVNIADREEMSSQDLSSQDTEPVGNVDEIVSSVSESDIVILEAEPRESQGTDTDVVEEEIEETSDQVEEYTKTASTPKALMKEIVEGRRESIASTQQNKSKSSEPQVNNVPAGDDAPFFEDNISNSPMTGAASFNVKKHEYAPYYKHIKVKIRLYWLLQYGTDASINDVTRGYKPIVVTFKVLPSGKIMNVAIADPAGNELLASKIRMSIQNTSLDKFPDYINEKHIDVKFSYFFY